jgi:hypothetical protein
VDPGISSSILGVPGMKVLALSLPIRFADALLGIRRRLSRAVDALPERDMSGR